MNKSTLGIALATASFLALTPSAASAARHVQSHYNGAFDNDGRTFGTFRKSAQVGTRRHRRHVQHRRRGHPRNSVSLAGVVAPLVVKIHEIEARCGSTVVSAVAGRAYHSNHPIGRAVDVTRNPSCIYAQLAGWPGGYSTDYATAPGGPHVHISYNPGGQEWGMRFVHRHTHRPRYARYAHVR